MTEYHDNTKVSDYRRCPRFFYFRHELGWVVDTPRLALAFGGAWHKAMDILWTNINDEYASNLAYDAFLLAWIGEYKLSHPDDMGPAEIEQCGMRHPFTAHEMLINYVAVRRTWISECEVLAIERPFIVSLSDDIFYAGRIDKIVKRRGKIHGIEHKTTSAYKKDGPFRKQFLESFSPDSQIDGYLFAGHELYGQDFQGIYVDGALVHKTIHDGFCMIPVQRHPKQLEAWKWETQEQVGLIRHNKGFQNLATDIGFMAAWPKNTNSCWDFNAACSYLNLCKSWPDPREKELPSGYVVDKWDPFTFLGLEELEKS